ncbi:YbaK/EbsC family protein [Labrys monachus]|uniref:Prolyl-tRNA editing enzyme YbaK/EbsC (Cys-tRNA(Pro) deacylase) n=1 Tax=Labrys monachus TaxID=217067 RepID=A0ABU0FM25_9HYPH|nr:YbaK/EbsC family protein [Labrys monachus]MDQ0395659.1 prolyl-tRNA editing enzyme YbaK/EbsC (Cys-tRNA(Pro) deacylase) [Labrys monachus]
MQEAIERVRRALLAAGHADTIAAFAEGTHTAQEAAASVGCSVAQIAKSIVFRAGDTPVLVIASGANRIDRAKVGAALGRKVERADPAWVAAVTGFSVGGVAPVGHRTAPLVLVDEDLLGLDPLWAAAGSPMHAFRTTAADLIGITGGQARDVKAV